MTIGTCPIDNPCAIKKEHDRKVETSPFKSFNKQLRSNTKNVSILWTCRKKPNNNGYLPKSKHLFMVVGVSTESFKIGLFIWQHLFCFDWIKPFRWIMHPSLQAHSDRIFLHTLRKAIQIANQLQSILRILRNNSWLDGILPSVRVAYFLTPTQTLTKEQLPKKWGANHSKHRESLPTRQPFSKNVEERVATLLKFYETSLSLGFSRHSG